MQHRRQSSLIIAAWLCCLAILPSGCGRSSSGRSVVIYTSVDQVYSEPVLDAFSAKTGIRVLPVYDVEAAKTTGLVSRILAEQQNPQADVFWNGEFAQTMLLRERGALEAYASPTAVGIPAQFRDPGNRWTGFAARGRVWLVNSKLVRDSESPRSIRDLLKEGHPASRIGMAYPLFGTTATHAAAIYSLWGAKEGRAFFEQVQRRGIRILDGNAAVRDLVANGALDMGLTDSDDACSAARRGDPVRIVIPDQGEGGFGTLLVPNTVALIAGGPHPSEARALIDFLLRPETENQLVLSGWCHFPLRKTSVRPECLDPRGTKVMEKSLPEIYREMQQAKEDATQIFVR
jgi:iron(III) transport system substrate-binding protein